MIRKLGKKADIGSTLAWVFALFIIVFIMAVFVAVAFVMAGKLNIANRFGSNPSQNKISYNPSSTGVKETLLTLLSTESNGKTFKTMILQSLDVYFDTQHASGKTLVGNIGDINLLSEQYLQIYNTKKMIEDDTILITEARKILDLICPKYMLKIPQGIILPGNENQPFERESSVEDAFAESKKMSEWSTAVTMDIPYRNQIIKLKFRILKECA